MTPVVHVEKADGVAVIRLDRPPVNAINSQMHGELAAAAVDVDADPAVRVVLIRGSQQAFAAGADIAEMADLGPAEITVFGRGLTGAIDALARVGKPVIAAVTGYALGGGLELALAADFRVVADDARLGLPEITLGVIPGAGGTQRLPRLIGPTRAKQMIFSGRPVSGAEAVTIGLASQAVPAAEVFAVAGELAARFVTGPPLALRAAKTSIDDGLDVDLATGLRLEATRFAALFASQDQHTGMASFLADGPGKAVFSGR